MAFDSGFFERVTRPAALVAAIGLVGFAAFQVGLALGAPWGEAAWGGGAATLAPRLRVASGFAAFILLAGALLVLGRAGYWRAGRNGGVFGWGTLGLAILLTISGLGNLASSSNWERFLNGPAAILLGLACLVVALGSRHRQGRKPLL